MKPSRALHRFLACGINNCIGRVVGMLVVSMGACGIGAFFTGPAWGAGGDILWQEELDRANTPNEIAAQGTRLYVAVADGTYLVRAYDGKTGTLLWQDHPFVDTPNDSSSANTITADDRRVYVAGRLGGDLLVRAYHGKSGRLLWQDLYDLAGGDDFAQKIVMEKGRVYVAGVATIRPGRPGDPGNIALIVRAYDAEDGEILWEDLSDRAAETQTNGVTSIAAGKGRVYVAGNRDSDALVRAYDADTGVLLWQDQEPIAGFTAIGAKHGQVYASGYRRYGLIGLFFVRAYDGDTGTLLWQDLYTLAGLEDSGSAAISISGRRVYAVGYGTSGINPGTGVTADFLVRAYDRKSGVLLWQDNFHGPGFRGNAALAVDSGEPAASPDKTARGDAVYVAGFTTSAANDTEFVVRAYEGRTGVLLWKDDVIRPGLDAAFQVVAEKGRIYAAGYVDADTAGHLFIRAYGAK